MALIIPNFPISQLTTFQRVRCLMEFMMTFLNLHSRNSRNTNISSDQSLLESRICEGTLRRGIRVGRHFPYRGFLISRQDFQGKTVPLLRYLQLLGKRSLPKMLWTSQTKLCRVSEWERGMAGVYYKMGEYMFSDSLMLRRGGRKRLPISIHVIVWVPRALVKYRLNFPSNSRCYIESSPQSVYGEPCSSSRIGVDQLTDTLLPLGLCRLSGWR